MVVQQQKLDINQDYVRQLNEKPLKIYVANYVQSGLHSGGSTYRNATVYYSQPHQLLEIRYGRKQKKIDQYWGVVAVAVMGNGLYLIYINGAEFPVGIQF